MQEIFIKIPHYSKLVERKKLMEVEHEKLINNKFNLKYNIEIYEKYDKEELNDEIINKYFNLNLNEWNRRVVISEQRKTNFKRKITMGEKSLIMKSINLWKSIIDNNINECLIIEDDVNLIENFSKNYLECKKNIPDDWDIIYINLEYLNEDDNKEKYFSSRREKVLFNTIKTLKKSNTDILNENKIINKEKCNDYFTLITKGKKWFMGSGYIINQKTARKFYDTITKEKSVLPIDAEIGYLIEKLNLNCYWLNFNLLYHNFTIDSSLSHERYLARKGKLIH